MDSLNLKGKLMLVEKTGKRVGVQKSLQHRINLSKSLVRNPVIDGRKTCNKCLTNKSISYFFMHKAARIIGIKSICKQCDKENANRYRINNPEKVRQGHKMVRLKRLEHYKEKEIISAQLRRKFHPWEQSFYMAKNRCEDSKRPSYKYYGGKGIKFLLTLKETEELWNRDKATLLKRPSIDRINSNGNYEYSNCQFIELSENSRKARKKNHCWPNAEIVLVGKSNKLKIKEKEPENVTVTR